MRNLFALTTLIAALLISGQLSAQQTSPEILTIIVNWEPSGKNQVFISEKGKETIEIELAGKFQEKDLSLIAKSLNELLNSYETTGWSLFSTFTMTEASNIQCFIFKKREKPHLPTQK